MGPSEKKLRNMKSLSLKTSITMKTAFCHCYSNKFGLPVQSKFHGSKLLKIYTEYFVSNLFMCDKYQITSEYKYELKKIDQEYLSKSI